MPRRDERDDGEVDVIEEPPAPRERFDLQDGESIEAALVRYEPRIFGRLMQIIMQGDNKDSLAAIGRIYQMAPARGAGEGGSFAERVRGRALEIEEAARDGEDDDPDGLEDD